MGRNVAGRDPRQAFLVMPFNAPHAGKLLQRIQLVCDALELQLRRGDSSARPQPIMADIARNLESSGIIIADLTGNNPNVMYEVGYAHACGAEPILIASVDHRLPFDVMATRCIFFDLSTPEGGAAFDLALAQAIREIRSDHKTTVLTSVVQRTEAIVSDLKTLAASTDEVLQKQTVWCTGFLSALAITEGEDRGDQDAKLLLLQERDAMIQAARRGCTLRLIITPPSEHDLVTVKLKNAVVRLRRLLAFFDCEDDSAHESIDWVVSPFRQKNVYIIGERCLYEGFKVGVQRGLPLSIRQTDPTVIRFAIQAHEILFAELVAHTLSRYPSDTDQVVRRSSLRASTQMALLKSLAFCESRLAKE